MLLLESLQFLGMLQNDLLSPFISRLLPAVSKLSIQLLLHIVSAGSEFRLELLPAQIVLLLEFQAQLSDLLGNLVGHGFRPACFGGSCGVC